MAALLPLRPLCPLRTPGGHSGREAEAVLSAELSPICSSSVPNPDKRRRDARPEPGRGRLGRARAVTILGAPELSNPAARRPAAYASGGVGGLDLGGPATTGLPQHGQAPARTRAEVVMSSRAVSRRMVGFGPGWRSRVPERKGRWWPHSPSGVRRRGSGPRSRRSSGAAPHSSATRRPYPSAAPGQGDIVDCCALQQ